MPVMMKLSLRPLAIAGLLLTAAMLTACSSIPLVQRDAAERARFEAYAGKPIAQYTRMTNYSGWAPISRDQLVVWTDINQAYLITVFRPCTDLMFARRIGVTSFADTVSAKFDFVKADGWKCMIKTIQPVDYLRMQQDERKARAAPAHPATPAPASSVQADS